jgi:hypothetical protein
MTRHVTSRHNIVDDHDVAFDVRHVTSRPQTLHRASGRRRRRFIIVNIFLRLIYIRKASEFI